MSPLDEAIDLVGRTLNGDASAADALEVLLRSYLETPPEPEYVALRLTPQEVRIMRRLFIKPGIPVTRDALLDAMYFDKPGSEPPHCVPSVQLAKLRKKLAGSRFHIPSPGRGYARIGYIGCVTA